MVVWDFLHQQYHPWVYSPAPLLGLPATKPWSKFMTDTHPTLEAQVEEALKRADEMIEDYRKEKRQARNGKVKNQNKTSKHYWVLVSIIIFYPYLGKWCNLTNMFQMGWNHQLNQGCFFPRNVHGCWMFVATFVGLTPPLFPVSLHGFGCWWRDGNQSWRGPTINGARK